MINNFSKHIEQILIKSQSSLDVHTINVQLNGSQETIEEILLTIRNNQKLFRIEPNGNISLRYDEKFREIVSKISAQFQPWGVTKDSEVLVLLFLLKVKSSRNLSLLLGLPEMLIEKATIKDFIFLALGSLNSNNEHFKASFDDILSNWKVNWQWTVFESFVISISTIPDTLFGKYFSDYTRVIGYKEWGTFNEPNPITGILVSKLAAQGKPKTAFWSGPI